MLRQLILAKLQALIIQDGPRLVNDIFVALGICFVLYLCSKYIVQRVKEKMAANTLQANTYTLRITHLVGVMLFIVLTIFNVLIGLEIIGIDTAVLMWWLTLAIGFALEETIGNMVSWLMLLSNDKIKVGKSFKLLWAYNELVKVEEFNIRYTVMRTLYKQRLIIPNMELLRTPIESKAYEELLRGRFSISLARQWDINHTKKIIKDLINSHEYVVEKERTEIIIEDFNVRWYQITVYYYFDPRKKKLEFTINNDIKLQIQKILEENNIKFSYPRQVREVEAS